MTKFVYKKRFRLIECRCNLHNRMCGVLHV